MAATRRWRALRRLLPRWYAERYADELLRDHVERAGPEAAGGARFWARLAWDAALTGAGARLSRRPAATAEAGGGGGTAGAALLQDLRFTLRSLRRRPGFHAAVIGTMALATGAATAVFSAVDTILLRPLPYADAERLVQVGTLYGGSPRLSSTSPPDFFDWTERTRSFEELAAVRSDYLTLVGEGEPARVTAAGVTDGFFRLLGVGADRGRLLRPDDHAPGAPRVAVLTHGAWVRRFGSDPSVVGRTLRFGGDPVTVVGVLAPAFHPPEAVYVAGVELWLPLRALSGLGGLNLPLDQRNSAFLQVLGKLREGVVLEGARRELEAVQAELGREYPSPSARSAGVEPLRERTVAGARSTLRLLLGAVLALLLLACANVANLFVVRAVDRRREMAVRTALGAGGGRLARQLLTESVLLALAGGLAGAGLAWGLVEAFRRRGPVDLPRLAEVAVDGRVVLVALAASAATGVVFGLLPSLRALRGAPAGGLRGGPRGGGVDRGRSRIQDALVIVQVTVGLVLLSGAGLLAHSLLRLHAVEPGFRVEDVAHLEVRVPEAGYETAEARADFWTRAVERVRALPGVAEAGATNNLPLTLNASVSPVTFEGAAPGDEPAEVSWHQVTPGFFPTMEIPLLRGRLFDGGAGPDGPPVAVVSRALAERHWPGEDPLGRRFTLGPADDASVWWTVVGVVGDVRQRSVDRPVAPELYLPAGRGPRPVMRIVARAPGDAAALLEPMRQAIWSLDPGIPLDRYGTMEGQLRSTLALPRFLALLLGGFAAVALVLAMVGLYGTLSYSVRSRQHEVGVRMALGAGRGRVLRMVLGRGAVLTAAGLALGAAAALAVGRLLESFVFEVSPGDPLTLGAAAAALAGLALLASWLPARRATRLDPVESLRSE